MLWQNELLMQGYFHANLSDQVTETWNWTKLWQQVTEIWP
jgi:hypothetical protein